jgi:hypothetical protein
MIYPYFGVKKIEEPLTHRGSLAFGLASAIHLEGRHHTFLKRDSLHGTVSDMSHSTGGTNSPTFRLGFDSPSLSLITPSIERCALCFVTTIKPRLKVLLIPSLVSRVR